MSLKTSLLLPKFIQRNIRNIMHRTDLKFIDLNQEDGTRVNITCIYVLCHINEFKNVQSDRFNPIYDDI
jgi:hypothetical protein